MNGHPVQRLVGLGLAAVTGVTASSGDSHALLIAIITSATGLVGLLLVPIVNDWIKSRRSTTDHTAAEIDEQRELVKHYISELTALREENDTLRRENDRLRRSHA